MLNQVQLIGNLGADPETRTTAAGRPVCKMSVATSERWKDKQGQKQERTEWHQVIAFDAVAENCQRYLAKGKKLFVQGQIRTRKWQDNDGNDRYTTEIIARDVKFLSPADQKPAQPAQQQAPAVSAAQEDWDDDIPF